MNPRRIPTGKILLLLTLTALLPLTALAVEENKVIPLPTSAPVASFATADPQASPYSPSHLESYYSGYSSQSSEYVWYQYPSLVAEEKERAFRLLADYQNGARPTLNALNVTEDVSLGVYNLKPADYEGETVYVLLPVRPLTDDELLAVIAAYDELGQTFDPDGLSYRNCARGGGIECSRFYAEEERERRDRLADLYQRQGIVCENPSVPLPGEDGLGVIAVNPEEFCGLNRFLILPYRPLTDEEILRKTAYELGEMEPVSASEYAEYEAQFRAELSRVLGGPLSLIRRGDGVRNADEFTLDLDSHAVYQCALYTYTLDGKYLEISGLLNLDTRKLDLVWWHHYDDKNFVFTDILHDPYDPRWEELAREAVETRRKDGTKIERIECGGESSLINTTGTGVDMKVLMEDGSYYSLRFAYVDESLQMIIYQASPPKPMDPSLINKYGGMNQ